MTISILTIPVKFNIHWQLLEEEKRRERHCVQARLKNGLTIRKKVWEKCERNKLFRHVTKFQKLNENNISLTKRDNKLVHRCDKLMTKFMLKAEKTKLAHSYAPWSPLLHHAWLEVKFYKLWYNSLKLNKTKTIIKKLNKLASTLGTRYQLYIDMASVKKNSMSH